MSSELAALRARLRDSEAAAERAADEAQAARAQIVGLQIELETVSARPASPVPPNAPPTPPEEPSPRKHRPEPAVSSQALDAAEAKIVKLEREIASFKIERKKIRCEFMSRRANQKYEIAVDTGAAVAKHRKAALEDRFRRLEVQRELVTAESRLGDATDRIDELRAAIDERDGQIAELTASLAEADSRASASKADPSELAAVRKTATEHKLAAKKAREEADGLREDLDEAIADAQTLRQDLSETRAEIARLTVRRPFGAARPC